MIDQPNNVTTEQPTRKIADVISVYLVNGKYALKINGEEFPWFVEDGIEVGPVATGQMPTVTVKLMALRVEVEHEIR